MPRRWPVQALIDAAPPDGHARDLLIEHLHRLNDHFHGLFERHLVALAAGCGWAWPGVRGGDYYHR